MSLLREIQDASVDPKIDVTFILRKCKILAARLGNQEFDKWVEQELNGYTDKNQLPKYRVLSVHSKGHFLGSFGRQFNNADIPTSCIPAEFREVVEHSYLMQPIAGYVSLLNSSKGDNLQEPWNPSLVAHVGQGIYEDMNCVSAWKMIPNAAIVGVVDSVRNRILNFVLEIEKEAPNAGELSPSSQNVSSEKVTQVFHTTIYGNVGNMAEGSTNVNQSATINVSQDDLIGLMKYLESIGVAGEDVKDLEKAISSDNSDEVKKKKDLGKSVKLWLGNMTSKIIQGTTPLLRKLSADLITKAILLYYGIK